MDSDAWRQITPSKLLTTHSSPTALSLPTVQMLYCNVSTPCASRPMPPL